jgi:hypothetical protein
LATNRYTDPTVVSYFKTLIQEAADTEVGYVTNDAYPVGWPGSINPDVAKNWFSGFFTSQGQFALPCLMQWRITGTQKYIDTVSQLMDYDQGLNPLGKCYMTGIGFNRTANPESRESVYAEEQGFGGPEPGCTWSRRNPDGSRLWSGKSGMECSADTRCQRSGSRTEICG